MNHPNIVTVHEVGESDSRSYIVMELVDGATLREVLASGPLPIRKLLDIAAQVAEGLAKAHASGIVHRDLKPENVMVTKEGFAKILDFGLAKLTQADLPGGPLTQTPTISAGTEPGVVLGTVGYMSPEQAGGKPADSRSDQFSFGSILYEMATGKRAFQRDTTVDTLSAILHDDPEPIGQANPKTPAPFRWIVERCLAKDPDERYESSRDMARDLRAARDHLSEATISGELSLAARPRPRSGLPPILAGPALIVAAAIGFYAARPFWKTPAPSLPRYHQLTFRRGTIFSARFAPDGQTIVYGAAWEGRPIELFSSRSDSPESRSLGLPEADILGISSSGEMALSLGHRFVFGDENNGTLARVPLAGGAPREILEKVQWADWAPEGARLALVRDVGGRNRLEFPIGKVLYQTSGWISHPRISPRGDLVAFLDHPVRDDDRGSVAVVDVSGKMRVLSSGWTTEEGLAWSAVGDEVWFSATRTGAARALQAVTLSGRLRLVAKVPGALTLHDIFRDGRVLLSHDNARFGIIGLPPGETTERDLSWLDWSIAVELSADGKTLLSGEDGEGAGANYAVYLRKTDGSPAVRLGDGSCLGLSPDGKWALSLTIRPPVHLVLLPTGAGEPKALPRGTVDEYHCGSWFPDGKRILFAGNEPGGRVRLYSQDIAGGNPRALTPEGVDLSPNSHPISPDGRFVAATGPDQRVSLYPTEEGQPRPIPGIDSGDVPIRWSADGASLYVYRLSELPARAYRLDLSSGRRQLWKELMPSDPAGVWSIVGIQFASAGNSYAYSYGRILSDLYLVEGLK